MYVECICALEVPMLQLQQQLVLIINKKIYDNILRMFCQWLPMDFMYCKYPFPSTLLYSTEYSTPLYTLRSEVCAKKESEGTDQ